MVDLSPGQFEVAIEAVGVIGHSGIAKSFIRNASFLKLYATLINE